MLHVLDVHQQGLYWAGRWREAKEICEHLIHDFPNNKPSVTAMMYLGEIAWERERNYDKAVEHFENILYQVNDIFWKRHAAAKLNNLMAAKKEAWEERKKVIQYLLSYVDGKEREFYDQLLSEIQNEQ
jgi:tetratricopeptide (TPR) repeat protein